MLSRERIQKALHVAATLPTWLILRATLVESTLREALDRRYEPKKLGPLPDREDVAEAMASVAKEVVELATNRRSSLDDKTKTLLTISSFLFPVALAGLATKEPRWYVYFPLLPLASAIWLLLAYLEVGTTGYPNLPALNTSAAQIRTAWARDSIAAANYNDAKTDHLANVFRGARRALVTALLGAAAVWFLAPARDEHGRITDKIFERLQEDTRLVEKLRGPEGTRGATGPQGPIGPQGPAGAPGKDAPAKIPPERPVSHPAQPCPDAGP